MDRRWLRRCIWTIQKVPKIWLVITIYQLIRDSYRAKIMFGCWKKTDGNSKKLKNWKRSRVPYKGRIKLNNCSKWIGSKLFQLFSCVGIIPKARRETFRKTTVKSWFFKIENPWFVLNWSRSKNAKIAGKHHTNCWRI